MKQREKRVLGRFVLLMGGTLLAIPIGGMIGVWMRPDIDVVTQNRLQTSPEKQLQSQLTVLAKTNDSPETLESGDLCYYAALHHATGRRFELSVLFLDALKERFPDSPFVQKAKSLRPLIATARKEKESPKEAAVAQARLAVEALPLLVGVYYWWTGNPGNLPTSSRPWWDFLPAGIKDFQMEAGRYSPSGLWGIPPKSSRPVKIPLTAGSVTMASQGTECSGWPVRYAKEKLKTSVLRQAQGAISMEVFLSGPWSLGFPKGEPPFRSSPCSALTSRLPEVVSILREHLDDPRLTGIPQNPPPYKSPPPPPGGWPFVPERVGRICYEILRSTGDLPSSETTTPPDPTKPAR